MRIYVGNLEFNFTDEELQQLFQSHGQVDSASIVRDRTTQQSKGFAFVEMPSREEAQAAITALNGKEIQQRALTVNEARPKEERSFSGNRGGSRPGFRSNAQNNQRGDKKGPSKRSRRQKR